MNSIGIYYRRRHNSCPYIHRYKPTCCFFLVFLKWEQILTWFESVEHNVFTTFTHRDGRTGRRDRQRNILIHAVQYNSKRISRFKHKNVLHKIIKNGFFRGRQKFWRFFFDNINRTQFNSQDHIVRFGHNKLNNLLHITISLYSSLCPSPSSFCSFLFFFPL